MMLVKIFERYCAAGNPSRVEETGAGELAAALDQFENSVIVNPVTYQDKVVR